MTAHPMFAESIGRLRDWAVTVLYGDDIVKFHPPGSGEVPPEPFPWHLALDALPHP
jgi:hypothetical protein